MADGARLDPGTLCIFGGAKVELAFGATRLIFQPRQGTPSRWLDAVEGGVSAIAAAAGFSAEEAVALRGEACAAGLLVPATGDGADSRTYGILLADILTSSVHQVEEGRVVVTAEEALEIPAKTPADVVRLALRLFVSRLDDSRLMAYAPLASRADDHAVTGDRPSAADLAALSPWLQPGTWPAAEVRAYRLAQPEDGPTGAIDASEAACRHGRGRLALAEVLHVSEHDDVGLWVAEGVQALPNLAFVVPFEREAPSRWCGGVAENEKGARVRCEAEGVERFRLGDVRLDELLRAPAAALEGEWLDPRHVVQYSVAQSARLGLQDFVEDTDEWWVAGCRRGEPVWLPAALVFCPFGPGARWLAPGHSSSNGGAAAPDPELAQLNAWLELYERDAFWRIWLRGTPPPKAELSAILRRASGTRPAEDIAKLSAALAHLGFVVDVLPASEGAIPTWVVVANSGSRLVIGACAGSDSLAVLRKAMIEAWLQGARTRTSPPPAEDAVRTPGDHGHLYSSTSAAERGRWLQEGPQVEVPDSWQHPTRVTASTTAAYYTRKHGRWWVARAIDPELLPLSFGYDQEPTGRSDFAALATAAGHEPLAVHPFA